MTKETTFVRLALHLAALSNQPGISGEMIELPLSYAPEAALEQDSLGRLALHYACANGADVTTIDALLEAYPRSASTRDVNGWLPIHVASCSGACFRVVQRLLDAYPESMVADRNQPG